MDQERFATLARVVGAARSRRAAIVAVAVAAVSTALPGLVKAGAPEDQSQLVKGCRTLGQRCRNTGNCCSHKCKGDRCVCVNRGGSCRKDVPEGFPPAFDHALCCSNRCDNMGICR